MHTWQVCMDTESAQEPIHTRVLMIEIVLRLEKYSEHTAL